MKKFCSKCGNQLDLGLKFCGCGAYNPFYIAGFTVPASISGMQTSSKVPGPEPVAINKLITEKQETFSQETIELVKEVRDELRHLEEENKRLKEEVKNIYKSRTIENNDVPAPSTPSPVPASSSRTKRSLWMILLVVLLAGSGFVWFYSGQVSDNKPAPAPVPAPVKTQVEIKVPVADSAKNTPALTQAIDTVKKLLATVDPPETAKTIPAEKVKVTPPAVNMVSKPVPSNDISENKVRGDIIGRKLSGCGIVVNDPDQIAALNNLVLVEKLPSHELKYKFTVKIKQGSDSYTANPYIYYSQNGVFIRIDGTNCE